MNDRTDAPTTGAATQQSNREARTSRVTELVEGEAGALLNYFARRTTTTDDAADLLGETLVVVGRRERTIPEDQVAARMWLYGVARKVLAGHHRSSRRRHALTERLSAELLTLPTPVANGEASTVRDLLSALPNIDQELIRLVYWDGFTIEEAATILSVRPGTARSRLSRARARLRNLMNEHTPPIYPSPERAPDNHTPACAEGTAAASR